MIAHEACQTLGVHLSPDGNWEMEVISYIQLEGQNGGIPAKSHGYHLQPQKCSSVETFLPSGHNNFSSQQCNQILALILQQDLPKTGVVCTFPRTQLSHMALWNTEGWRFLSYTWSNSLHMCTPFYAMALLKRI